ncbi:hypothetical protein Ciccas_000292 [Cichlidogyrus casuarinus]|uniref:Uncharacterized protein n=1 Tax=Cichlidogyrus casuarinus TaxID=1844966 RepID=A0ABD2QN99_9PLAT
MNSKTTIVDALHSMNSVCAHCDDVNKAVLSHFKKTDDCQDPAEELPVFDEADVGDESGKQLFLNVRSKSDRSNPSLRVYLVNSSEFAESVSDLETCLHNFWKAGERCKSLKLCLQLVKHLNYERYLGLPQPMEHRFINFYPAKFMMITGILETFQSLLLARLNCHAMLGKAANWFEKVSSVRELLNRVYIVSCLLKPLFMVGYLDMEKTMIYGTKLILQCRGLGNPIISLFAQCWIVRCITSLMDQQDCCEVREIFFDKHLMKIPINDFVVLWPQYRCHYASFYSVLAPAIQFLYQASIRTDFQVDSNYNFCENLRSPLVVMEWNSESFLKLQLKQGPIEPLLSAIMNTESEVFLLENAEELARKLTPLLFKLFPELLSQIVENTEAKLPLFSEYCFIICKLAPHLEYERALRIFEIIWPHIMSFENLKDQLACLDACCDFVLKVKCLPGLIFAELNKKIGQLPSLKHTLIDDLADDTEIGQIVNSLKSICQKVVKNNNFEIKILLENEHFQSFLDLFNQNPSFLDLCSQLLNRFNNEHLSSGKSGLPDKPLSYDDFLLGLNLVKRVKNSVNRLSAQVRLLMKLIFSQVRIRSSE